MTDHKDEATYHGGGELPRREPFETLAEWDRHARPADPNDRTAYASPGVPPWGSLSHDIGHAAPRKRRIWPWVLAAVVLVLACGVGGLALVGAGGKAVVDSVDQQVSQQATDRKADIKLTSCSLGEFGLVTVRFTVHNSSAQAQSYLPQFDIEDGKGTVYGQATGVVNELAPGKDYKGSAVGQAEVPARTKITCALTGA